MLLPHRRAGGGFCGGVRGDAGRGGLPRGRDGLQQPLPAVAATPERIAVMAVAAVAS